nr:MAG TPA: hypothetical protein [Caudoviricetes sp.]DAO08804.1 MAG TPA: hypothetical protein [Caudoviricetes sp.]DAU95358.1 MAG TPA: hypothetical protein [Caudoviricetes sp.]
MQRYRKVLKIPNKTYLYVSSLTKCELFCVPLQKILKI